MLGLDEFNALGLKDRGTYLWAHGVFQCNGSDHVGPSTSYPPWE